MVPESEGLGRGERRLTPYQERVGCRGSRPFGKGSLFTELQLHNQIIEANSTQSITAAEFDSTTIFVNQHSRIADPCLHRPVRIAPSIPNLQSRLCLRNFRYEHRLLRSRVGP